ncbi:DNA-binding protein [Endozoicomonas sp. G2_2]|nr:DNA-binding protein [Endozoicomonas sp. G2_2]
MNLEQARQWFVRNGVAIGEWADARGFTRQTVYAVLSGRSAARRGESYRVAVALGLKEAPVSNGSPHDDPVIRAGPGGVNPEH